MFPCPKQKKDLGGKFVFAFSHFRICAFSHFRIFALFVSGSFVTGLACTEQPTNRTIQSPLSVSYSQSLGEVRSGLFRAVNSNLDLVKCDNSIYSIVGQNTALGLITNAYGQFKDKGSDYAFVVDLLSLDNSVVAVYGCVDGNDLLYIPYPDDLNSYLTIPSGLGCNNGLVLNLTQISDFSGDTCPPCRGCEGSTGNCCSCTCMSGCGNCFWTGSCGTPNCCGGGEFYLFPQSECSTSQPAQFEDHTLFSTLGINDHLGF